MLLLPLTGLFTLLFFFFNDGQPFFPIKELLFLFFEELSLKNVWDAGGWDWL